MHDISNLRIHIKGNFYCCIHLIDFCWILWLVNYVQICKKDKDIFIRKKEQSQQKVYCAGALPNGKSKLSFFSSQHQQRFSCYGSQNLEF